MWVTTQQSLSSYYYIHQETLRMPTVMIIGNHNLSVLQDSNKLICHIIKNLSPVGGTQ